MTITVSWSSHEIAYYGFLISGTIVEDNGKTVDAWVHILFTTILLLHFSLFEFSTYLVPKYANLISRTRLNSVISEISFFL